MNQRFIVLLALIALGVIGGTVKFEDKEETCFVLATRGINNRNDEISEHLAKYSELVEQDYKNKIIEDAFNYCMGEISVKEIKKLGGTKIRPFEMYEHLVKVKIDKYRMKDELVCEEGFNDYKVEIAKRVAMKSMERGPDL
ncbi:hypothetical protein SteCoe_31821 [Stentor coeruleus]|uniref:Uncharacterized protein n=1 Tax=Stentor coeruleus TaxID=5963 RepID=A0A1R2B0E7_9CILI|nr:hypothetical protein SteCoe_31821 [Stentor coeruleus]